MTNRNAQGLRSLNLTIDLHLTKIWGPAGDFFGKISLILNRHFLGKFPTGGGFRRDEICPSSQPQKSSAKHQHRMGANKKSCHGCKQIEEPINKCTKKGGRKQPIKLN